MMRLAGRHYDHGQPVWIEINNGLITETGAWHGTDAATLPWIAPGLVDLQVNGFAGEDFTDARLTGEAVERVSLALDCDGVTTYLPTVVTQSFTLHTQVLRTIAEAIETRPRVRQRVAGIHLEGPYISPEDGPRGAHPRAHCRPPNWDEFQWLQDAARGYVKIITLSPEFPGAEDFIRHAVASGVVVSLGHTNATCDQIRAAVDAGARLSTHLGNGAHAFIHRHTNYIWEQLADDRLTATLIADGHHLPASVLKCLVRGKTPERVVLISDITGIARAGGTKPGLYEHAGLGRVEVLDDGRAVVAGQREYLAGATQPLQVGVTNVMRLAGLPLAAAIDMASARPAGLLGCPCGQLTAGSAADLIQFHLPAHGRGMHIVATVKTGECVYGAACVES
jgi:N-acetylglucosamine-6-phosphate deacetylase